MFIRLIFQARHLERRRRELLKEKQDSYQTETKLTRSQKYRHFCTDLQRRLLRCCKFPKHSPPFRLCFSVRHNGTCENFVAKSIAGFLGGFLLTYIFFMFFVLQLNFTLSTATIMCAIFGSILTLGLAFSYKVRCIVFLVLPQFFSKKGRQALLAYAYILAITGPAKNTLNNMSILGESLACGQEQLKAAVKQILEVIKKPFYAIRDAVKKVVVTVKEIVKKIKEILLTIKRIIMSLVKIIKSAFDFIGRMMNICNTEFGTPYQRCERVFEDAVVDCNAKLGPMFNWLCNITYLVKNVCFIAKALDLICVIVDFIKATVGAIVTKVKQFIRHIRTMFYVRIKFSHSYRFESNHTKSMGDITTGIVTEIKQRSSGLIKIFDFMSSAASLFFIFMVGKVIYYRHKFLTNEMFDNKFITRDFRKLDLRRAQMGLETVLPLNHRERKLYISTSSMRLVKKEKSRLSEAAMILLMSTLKLSTHMATDYSLYWIMMKIRYYGRFQSKIDAPNMPSVNIDGEGFLASLLRGVVKAFHPLGVKLEIDTVPCLPDPIPPDYDRYIQIGSLLVLCWFLAIFEPYGLRFRHSVMCYYHPQRARERTIWLYNHILRSRSSFLKFARRQLRRKVMSDKSINKITCSEFLRSRFVRWAICVFLFGPGKQSYCLLCGEVHREGDNKKFIQCQTPKCPGLYCEQCFQDLQNLCTVCLDPISYGDLSDVSEEKDSSDDEVKKTRRKLMDDVKNAEQEEKKKKKKKKRRKRKRKEEDKKGLLEKQSDYSTGTDTDGGGGEGGGAVFRYNLQDWEAEWSSDYDQSYQQFKDISKKSEDATPRVGHSDVEKQSIPHYASMQDFHDNTIMAMHTDDVFDTSSMITDLSKASFHHLNQKTSTSTTKQGWLLRKRSVGVQKRSTSATPLSTSLTTSAGQYYDSPESVYEQPKDLPLHRINSKMSMDNAVPITPTVIGSTTSEAPTMSYLDESSTSTVESPALMAETTFIHLHQDMQPTTEVKQSEMNISKGEKDLINGQLKEKEKHQYDSPVSEEESFRVEPLTYLASETSPDVSPLTRVWEDEGSSTITDLEHPCVPRLDLKFLERDSQEKSTHSRKPPCSCSTSMTRPSSCNCRLYKDHVHFNVIDERGEPTVTYRSETGSILSSSLISSLYCLREGEVLVETRRRDSPANFSISPAHENRVVSTCQLSLNTSERSVQRCSLDMTSVTSVTGSQSQTFSPPPTDRNDFLTSAEEEQSLRFRRVSERDLYNTRIKSYYKQVHVPESGSSSSVTVGSSEQHIQRRGGFLRGLFSVFKSKK